MANAANVYFSDVLNLLRKYNYKTAPEELEEEIFFDGYPDESGCFNSFNIWHSINADKCVSINMRMKSTYIEKYKRILEKNPNAFYDGNEKFNWSNCIIDEIFIAGPITTETICTNTNLDSGISLTNDDDKFKYAHLHNVTLPNIEKALWIQHNLNEYTKFILEKHIHNIELMTNICLPTLRHYDFIEKTNSLFHDKESNDSTIYISYIHPNTRGTLFLETDLLTGELRLTGSCGYWNDDYYINDDTTEDEFRKYFINNIVKNNKLELAYVDSDDPNENINSYFEILDCYDIINPRSKSYRCEGARPNLKNIPERYEAIGNAALYMYDLKHVLKRYSKNKK